MAQLLVSELPSVVQRLSILSATISDGLQSSLNLDVLHPDKRDNNGPLHSRRPPDVMRIRTYTFRLRATKEDWLFDVGPNKKS